MPNDPRFSASYSEYGFPVKARITHRGRIHEYEATHALSNRGATCDGRFLVNRAAYLRLRAAVSVRQELVEFSIAQGLRTARIRIDFSRYDETHKVFIIAAARSQTLQAEFDPRLGGQTGEVITIEQFLSGPTRQNLKVWSPLFRDSRRIFEERLAPYETTIIDIIENSVWKKAGRAACWGLGSVAAGAVCVGGFGVGCAVGLFVCGAAASICSDSIK